MGTRPTVLLAALLAGGGVALPALTWYHLTSLTTGRGVVAALVVVLVAAAALALGSARAGKRASTTERPGFPAALRLAIAGLWTAALSVVWPRLLEAITSLDFLSGAAAAMEVLMALALIAVPVGLVGAALPYLVRTSVADLATASRAAGYVVTCARLGTALGLILLPLLLPEAAAARILQISAGALLLAGVLMALGDRALAHGQGTPGDAVPGRQFEGRGPVLAAALGGLLIGAANVAWITACSASLLDNPLLLMWIPALACGALVVGSLLGAWFAPLIRRVDLLIPGALYLAGLVAIGSVVALEGLPRALLLGENRRFALLMQVAMIVAPTGILVGAIRPMAIRVRTDWTGTASLAAARLASHAALGLIVGVLLAALLGTPLIGTTGVLFVAGLLIGLGATLLRVRALEAARVLPALIMVIPLVVIAAVPGTRQSILGAEPPLSLALMSRAPLPRGITLENQADVTTLARYVTMRENASIKRYAAAGPPTRQVALANQGGVLLTGGQVRAHTSQATEPSARDIWGLALCAAGLGPKPTRALVVGPDDGRIVEVLLTAGAEHIDVAGVTSAVREAWTDAGRKRMDDARVHLHAGDGIQQLRRARSSTTYDVIVLAPATPSLLGNTWRGTREGYADVAAALSERGLVAEAFPFDQWPGERLRRVLATCEQAFPGLVGWRSRSALVLAGQQAPRAIEAARFADLLQTLRDRGATWFHEIGDFWKHVAFDSDSLARGTPLGGQVYARDTHDLLRIDAKAFLDREDDRSNEAQLLDPAFPPNMDVLLPSLETRETWLAAALRSLLDEGAGAVARLYSEKLQIGRTNPGRIGRARAALAAGAADRALGFLNLALGYKPEGAMRAEIDGLRIEALAILVLREPPPRAGPLQPKETRRDQLLAEIDTTLARHEASAEVQYAAAIAFERLGNVKAAQASYARMRATETWPPGSRMAYARFLMSEIPGSDAEIARILEGAPVLDEDPEALDLYLRIRTAPLESGTVDPLPDRVITLYAEAGRELRDAAQIALARRSYTEAAVFAREASERLQGDPFTQELRAVTWILEALEATDRGTRARESLLDGLPLLQQAVAESSTPEATRVRARVMARWMGLPPPSLQEDSGGTVPEDPATISGREPRKEGKPPR